MYDEGLSGDDRREFVIVDLAAAGRVEKGRACPFPPALCIPHRRPSPRPRRDPICASLCTQLSHDEFAFSLTTRRDGGSVRFAIIISYFCSCCWRCCTYAASGAVGNSDVKSPYYSSVFSGSLVAACCCCIRSLTEKDLSRGVELADHENDRHYYTTVRGDGRNRDCCFRCVVHNIIIPARSAIQY